MKITEYQKVASLAPNDIMLIDGAGGTRTIEPKDAIAPQLNALREDISELEETKANVDGYYTMMTAGRAEDLIDTRATGVARNFTFDTAAGTDSIEDLGTAEIKSIHGNTIVWNQLYSAEKLVATQYAACTVDTNGVVTVRSTNDVAAGKTARVATPIAGHKYYISSELADVDTNGSVYVGILKSSGAADGKVPSEVYSGTDWLKASGIVTASNDATQISLRIVNAAASGTSAKFRNIVVCDLTMMFGAGNEPATAADFEALFPRTDYVYDAGSLLNFNGTGIKTVGFNLLGRKPELITGSISTIIPLNRNTFARLKAGVTYRIETSRDDVTRKGRWMMSFYGIEGNELDFNNAGLPNGYYKGAGGAIINTADSSVPNVNFTPLVDCYLCVNVRKTSGNFPDPLDVTVHTVWSGYRNGEYEAYWTRTLDLPIATYFPDGMRSVGTTFDELTADKAVKRIGSRAYADGDEDDPTVLTDGTETLYALAEPVVTDIETPLNLVYQIDDFGTEELLPANDDEPTTSPFSGIVAYSTAFPRQISNMPKNYTSQATLDELLEAIGGAIGGTFTKTWNASTGKWTFTFEEDAE